MKNIPQHTISPAGIALIKQFEGCKLTAYLCAANKVTIGFGHVIVPSWDVGLFPQLTLDYLTYTINDCLKRKKMTQEAQAILRIDQAKADALLAKDAQQVALFLNSVLPVELNQNQFDALCSLIFNIGPGNYATSNIKKKLAHGDLASIPCEFDKWVFATVNGEKKRLPGLINRRASERALFEAI